MNKSQSVIYWSYSFIFILTLLLGVGCEADNASAIDGGNPDANDENDENIENSESKVIALCEGSPFKAVELSRDQCDLGRIVRGDAVPSCTVTVTNPNACNISLEQVRIENYFFETEDLLLPKLIEAESQMVFMLTGTSFEIGAFSGDAVLSFRYAPETEVDLVMEVIAPTDSDEPIAAITVSEFDGMPYQGFEAFSPLKSLQMSCAHSAPSRFASRITSCDWMIEQAPSNSSVEISVETENTASFSFGPQDGTDLIGRYQVRLSITDDTGRSSSTTRTFETMAPEAYEAYFEVIWVSDAEFNPIFNRADVALCDTEMSCRPDNCLRESRSYTIDFDQNGETSAGDPAYLHHRTNAVGPQVFAVESPAPGSYQLGIHVERISEEGLVWVFGYQDGVLRLQRGILVSHAAGTRGAYFHLVSFDIEGDNLWTVRSTADSSLTVPDLVCEE